MRSRDTGGAAPRGFGRRDVAVLLLLLATTLGLFTASWQLTSSRRWTTPLGFSGDALFELAALRTAADAGAHCLWSRPEPRLGAPFGTDWADFPGTDDAWLCAGGVLAGAFGPFAALNLLYAFAAMLAAFGLYVSARTLGAAPAPAAAAALLFALSPYLFTRNVHHLGLSLFGLMPFAVLVWRRLAQPFAPRHRVAPWVALAALLGAQSIYYALYTVLGVGMVGVVQAWRRRWREVRVAVLCAAATLAVVLALNADTFALWSREGRNPAAFARSPHDAVVAALWPEQLVIPSPFHRFGVVREAVAPYARWVGGRGEYPSAYLGAVGAAALAGLIVIGARRSIRTRRLGPTSRSAALVLAWVALALPVGGLAGFARLTGVALLRSNDRVSVILLAVALLWLAVQLTRWTAKQPGWRRGALAAGVAAVGLFEQVPLTDPDVDPAFFERTEAAVAGTRRLADELGLRRVFVYPPSTFPEDPRSPFGDPYRPLAPFVVSRGGTFSAGGLHGRRGGDWPFEVARLPDDAFAEALQGQGFTALVTTEAACDASCAARLERVMAQLSKAKRLAGGADWTGWAWDARP